MLRTIPKRIMTNNATLKIVQSTDRWGNPTYTEIALSKVNLQPTHNVVKNAQDKEITLNSVLFYDPRVSKPVLDWNTALIGSAIQNGQAKVVANGITYTVHGIDLLCDDEGKLHHIEVWLY